MILLGIDPLNPIAAKYLGKNFGQHLHTGSPIISEFFANSSGRTQIATPPPGF